MRTIKHTIAANNNYPILSVIAVGTFGILGLDSSKNYDTPFNVRNPLQNPNLSKEQVQKLFSDFESDQKIKVAPNVVEDVYFQTNGYVLQAKFGSLKSIINSFMMHFLTDMLVWLPLREFNRKEFNTR